MQYQRLGQMLVTAGCITQDQLDAALAICARRPKAGLVQVLLEQGTSTAEAVNRVLTEQLGISFTDPSILPLSGDLAALVPRHTAVANRVVPLRLEGDVLYLAMADPLDDSAVEAVRLAARKKILPMLAAEDAIELAIHRLYGADSAKKALRELLPEMPVSELPSHSSNLSENAAPTIRLVNSFLEFAASRNASDIHLEPRERELAVRMRIDGILHQTFSVPKQAQNSIIARIKVMGELDLAEHQLPQDGRCSIRLGSSDIDLRISTLPTIHGEKAVIRLLHHAPTLLNPQGIGLAGQQLQKFHTLLQHRSGVILMAGPTGSGKSSTMYTMIGILNTPEVNLITLEDPVEYHWDRVNQVQVHEKAGITFASGLRSILRQDPDIIAVGEIRDTETADVAMRAAITGHLVLSTIHADDAPGAIERLLDMGVAPYLIASGLKGIIAQRLVRKICPHCREGFHLSPAEQKQMGIPGDPTRRFFRGRGCPHCFHTGYLGRTAVFEILPITSDIRRCLSEAHPREALESVIRKGSDQPLLAQGLRLAESGITTPEEIFRVLSPVSEGGRTQ